MGANEHNFNVVRLRLDFHDINRGFDDLMKLHGLEPGVEMTPLQQVLVHVSPSLRDQQFCSVDNQLHVKLQGLIF